MPKKYHNPVAGYHGYSNAERFARLQAMCGHPGGQVRNYGTDHNVNHQMRAMRSTGNQAGTGMTSKVSMMRKNNRY